MTQHTEEHLKAKKIPLMEVFGPTIQGEGSVIGQQTYFLRFGGCDYKCAMCDSMHAVDPEQIHQNAMWLTQDQIIWRLYAAAKLDTTNWVTLSGGNPCIHDLTHLCRILKAANWKIAVETQGTIYHPWIRFCDVVTVSPKAPGMGEIFEPDKFRPFIEQMVLHKGLNIKIVVFDRKDLDFARYIFKECMAHSMDPSQFYLSQGNPIPPQKQTPHYVMEGHINLLKGSYLQLFDWIKEDLVLSQVKFLPQWHVWLWGNKQGV